MTKIKPSEITPESIYWQRRTILKSLGLLTATYSVSQLLDAKEVTLNYRASKIQNSEIMTSWKDATHYNNFYEFGTDKTDPANNSSQFSTNPWNIIIEGQVKKNKTIGMEDLLKKFQLEERIYRHRCVEAWSMVIPWIGISLKDFIHWCEPTNDAKFVEFVSLADPKTMPGVANQVLAWPYTEALRMDEATNSLPILALGMYGKTLPNQNGAPVRLIVPWKYGFKGIKSIVKIRFTDKQPQTTWNLANPNEYGFYSNVNPQVDHPRWSQATERRIGEGLFAPRHKTLMFNGYAEEVAYLYKGMDLVRNF